MRDKYTGYFIGDRTAIYLGIQTVKHRMTCILLLSIPGKHPVSALAEICTKRKMGIPAYSVVMETGHSYAKVFLMKVQVESVEYQPSESSPNKKHAKAMAATMALDKLGLAESA